MEKIRLAENSCYILLKYFDCANLTKVMENKILDPRSEVCIEVYRRLYVCKKTKNKFNNLHYNFNI